MNIPQQKMYQLSFGPFQHPDTAIVEIFREATGYRAELFKWWVGFGPTPRQAANNVKRRYETEINR